MSGKECEIVQCIQKQLEMMPDTPLSDLEQSPIPHHKKLVASLTLGNSGDSLRYPSQI